MALLTARERRQAVLLVGMVIGMAVFDTIGVASILPFLSVLADPTVVESNPVLSGMYSYAGFSSVRSFLLALGAAAFLLVVFSAVFRICTQYAMNRFVQMRRHSISQRLLETYLRQPYVFFIQRHSGDMAKSILSEVDALVINVFKPLFDVIAYGFVALAIVTLLVLVDARLALAVGVVIGGLYGLLFASVKRLISRIGRERVVANEERFKAAGDALSGIKEIKVLGREHGYLFRFMRPSMAYASYIAVNMTLSQVPKYLVEAVGVGGILVIAIFLMVNEPTGSIVLPVLGLYAFAGYRLLPAAQNIYSGITNLRFGRASIDTVYDDLVGREAAAELSLTEAQPWSGSVSIELKDVWFRYPGQDDYALKGVSLTIPAGSSIGLIGETGSGKTTLIDLILGLLEPTRGQILIGGKLLNADTCRSWQRSIGYVPQSIFLTDHSVSENIALGVPVELIAHDAVRDAARHAQLDDFIVSSLQDGYATTLGDRGVRLSGGQRQRIGIARALYRNPRVIVFDEATSALDGETEQAVINAVKTLQQGKTIISIAHRLTTVSECDKVILLEGGVVAAEGSCGEVVSLQRRHGRLKAP